MATAKTTTKTKTGTKSGAKSSSTSTNKALLLSENLSENELNEQLEPEKMEVVEMDKEVEVEVKRPATKVKLQEKVYSPADEIPCESVTLGLLGMKGLKSGMNYRWLNEGDVVNVEYQDLIAAINRNSPYVMKPYFIVRDDAIVKKYPKLKEMYATMYNIEEMKNVLYTSTQSQLKRVLLSLPAGAKDTMATLVRNEVANGNFDSLTKMKTIDELLGTNLVQLVGLIG